MLKWRAGIGDRGPCFTQDPADTQAIGQRLKDAENLGLEDELDCLFKLF
jgi:hypothetical protein